LEIKQKEMNTNVQVASKNMEELKRRHEQEKRALEENKAQLEKLRAEAKMARDLEEKHINERAQLKQRILELDQKAAQEHQNADQLLGQHRNLENEIAAQKQNIVQDESKLKDREHVVISQKEERKTLECHAKEQLKNEELARKKAEELACKTSKERRDLQQDVSRLVKEEQDAKKKVCDLEKTANVKVEEKPATVDVYQHTQYETKEPVITEIKTEEQKANEDKSIGAKIVDGVKNLF